MLKDTMIPSLEPLTAPEHAAIVAHTECVTALMIEAFGEIPLVFVTYPEGLGNRPVFHKGLEHAPKTIPTVDVRTSSGLHPYVKLSEHNVPWLVRGRFAVELQSWSPIATDPERAAFARITLEPQGSCTEADIAKAAFVMAELLGTQKLQAIPVLDGVRGMALYIPLAQGPAYSDVAAWADLFVQVAAETVPNHFTIARSIVERGDRIYLGSKTNHPGMSTILPFSLRGLPHLPVACPLAWDKVGTVYNGMFCAENFSEYFEQYGNMFVKGMQGIGEQSLGPLPGGTKPVQLGFEHLPEGAVSPELARPPHSYITNAAIRILADGVVRSSDEILAAAIKAGILPESLPRKYVYVALHEYITRTVGVGRKPVFVQLEGNHFRINRPLDDWPSVSIAPLPQWIEAAAQTELETRLRATSVGTDPAAFEIAVCDAVRALGFIVEHIGGNGEPDGIADAPLGSEGYRCILECKTATPGSVVSNPRAEEPAGFREAHDAQYAVLIGPAFNNEASFDAELQAHQVALWTVDDIVALLKGCVGPDEIRPALATGRSSDAIEGILWERDHGRRKRLEVLVALIAQQGWKAQVMLNGTVPPAEFPRLTRDSLLMLVDQGLTEEGVHEGATPSEFDTALSLCVARGMARKTGDGVFILLNPC